MSDKEFYIGWMPEAPRGFAWHIKKVIIVLMVFILAAGILLALSQKKFGTGNFEFGRLTEVKGIYCNQPVPCLKAVNGKNIFGNPSYITIPLIGNGKFGADGVMAGLEKENHTSFNQKEITLKGTLLCNNGKVLMQVDMADHPLVAIGGNAGKEILPVKEELGEQTIKGEIVDPKCFFGVMKPGQGKPHKDCAIRCILGGMPPVLRVSNEMGEENYYFIVDANGGKMNQAVKDFVAEPVTMRARVVKYDDWIVLYVKDGGLQRYSWLQDKYGGSIQYCMAPDGKGSKR
jgi:hypothetical protein